MESLFEKLTLYDLLGYTVPGAILVVAMSGLLYSDELSGFLEQGKDYPGLIIIVFVLCSYIVGLIIGELSRWVVLWVEKSLDEEILPAEFQKEEINKVLLCVISESNILKKEVVVDTWKNEYFGFIYSDIQADANYKRIHNYASAQELYKNLSMTFFIITIGTLIRMHKTMIYNIYDLFLLSIFLTVLFIVRWIRFREKRNYYALMWFIEKYNKESYDNYSV